MRRRGLSGAFWPAPTQHDLLRVVLGPADGAAERWRSLGPVDVAALEPGSFGVLPLLAELLAATEPDEPRLPLLLGTKKSVWYRNQLLLGGLAALAGELAADGVDAVLVGGVAAMLRWYPGLVRPVGLVEVMVAPGEVAAFRASARRAGWRHSRDEPGRSVLVDGGGRTLVAYEGAPPFVAGRLGPAAGFAALTADAVELELRGVRMRALAAADDVVFTCGMGARTLVPPSVLWLVDVHMALTSGERPDAEALVGRARAFRLVEHLRDTLSYLAEVAGGLDEYVRAVARERVSRRDRLTLGLGGTGADSALVGVSLKVAAGLRSERRAWANGTVRCRPEG